MKTVRITFQGRVYELGVEVLDTPAGSLTTPPVASKATVVQSPVTPPPPLAEAEPRPPAPAAPPHPSGGTVVASPMAAIVLSVMVKPGDTVAEGRELLMLEAMKMQAPVFAPCAGVVGTVLVGSGTAVMEGEPMLWIT